MMLVDYETARLVGSADGPENSEALTVAESEDGTESAVGSEDVAVFVEDVGVFVVHRPAGRMVGWRSG